MNTARIRFVVFSMLLPAALGAQAEPPAYTLEECIRIGLERAVSVQNAARDREIAEASMKQARSQALPQIDLAARYTRTDGETAPFVSGDVKQDNLSGSVTLSQTLYEGGKVRAAIRAAGAYRGYTAELKTQKEAALVRDIHRAFNGILLAQANVAVREESLAQLEAFADQSRQKYEAGTASEFDRLTAQVRLANERPLLIEARNALAVAKESFRNLIVLDDADYTLNGTLDYVPFDADLSGLLKQAAAARPELRAQDRLIDLRREDLTVARGGYKPVVSAEAVYSQENPDRYDSTRDEWEDYWQAGVSAKWALFDGGRRRGDVMEKALELAKTEALRDDLRRGVALEVTAARLEMLAAREVIAGAEENVRLAEKALEIARTRYDAGLGTWLEFNDSNLALNTARLNYFQALEKHLRAVTDLNYAAGTLLPAPAAAKTPDIRKEPR